MAVRRIAWGFLMVFHAAQNTQGQVTTCTSKTLQENVSVLCNIRALSQGSNGVSDKLRAPMSTVVPPSCMWTLALRLA